MTPAGVKILGVYNSIEIMHISKPEDSLLSDPQLKSKILTECREVQLEVWNPKMSIEENTIKNSGLTLLSHAGNFIGFISYQVLQCSNSHILYFHDLMIKKSFQSLGLFRTALMMSIVCASQDYKMDEFTGMTITYNARVIKSLYFKPHIFKNISFPTPSNKHKMLLREHGSHFFDPRELDIENGIVRKMWLQSKKDGQHINDNSELSILTGTYLNPVDGDSIVLLFDIDEKSIEHINNFLKERVGQTP